jgi:hypothetical protein
MTMTIITDVGVDMITKVDVVEATIMMNIMNVDVDIITNN